MAFMRSTLAYALLWLNLIFTFLILFFFARISPKSKDLDRILLYINFSSFVPILMLIFSFCVTKNECCSTDKEVNEGFAIGSCFGLCLCCGSNCLADKPRNQINQIQQGQPNQNQNSNSRRKKGCCDDCGDCGNCGGSGDDGEGCACLIFILLIAFIALFCLIKACGKHISRIISVILLFLIDCSIAVLAILSGNDLYRILIMVISIIAAICNLLGIILPNLSCCQILNYGYVESLYINANPVAQKPMEELVPGNPYVPVYNGPNQGLANSYNANPNPQNNYVNYAPPQGEGYPNPI